MLALRSELLGSAILDLTAEDGLEAMQFGGLPLIPRYIAAMYISLKLGSASLSFMVKTFSLWSGPFGCSPSTSTENSPFVIASPS